ncbi:MAG: hypothetical protein EOP53_21495, partial [Sphingobacteriales bacterium]
FIDAIAEDKYGHIWLACNDGLWQYSNGKVFDFGRGNKLLQYRINDIKIDKDGTIWLASQGKGVISVSGKTIKNYSSAHGLLSDLCNRINIDNDNNIWVSTYRGLNKIAKNKAGKVTISAFTTATGLISNEILDCIKFRNNLWVFTGNGVSYFDPNAIKKDTVLPKLYITKVEINNKLVPLKNRYSLSHLENNMAVNFIALYFKNAGKIHYRYRLAGGDTAWSYTDNTSVEFGILQPGNYRFLVSAQNNSGIWSGKPASFSFTIHPPFWQTGWFIVLVLLCILGSILLLFNLRISYIVKQKNLSNELDRYKNSALQARMNPHFIFNSLNSINNFILQNDKKNSSRYLSKFANLMRFILDNSAKTNITLEDELRGLKLYLELEKQRFKDKLNYRIDVFPDINTNMRVPSLILQPFVENAILHGILHKPEPGFIYVIIHKHNNRLVCTIEDDGIGREKSKEKTEKKMPGHVSNGIEVTRQRLDLLNKLQKEKTNLKITDLADENGKPNGTRVEISWPLD